MERNAQRGLLSLLAVFVFAAEAPAHEDHYRDGYGGMTMQIPGPDMMGMGRSHDMMGSAPGYGMMGGQPPGHGPMGGAYGHGMLALSPGMDMMTGGHGLFLMNDLDADNDGRVTPEDMRSGLDDLRQEHDADGDGTLSIDEFEAMHSALIRQQMVRRFQFLDRDGDGAVTEEEMAAPARMAERRHRMQEHMWNEAHEGEPMPRDGHDGMMDDGRPPQGHDPQNMMDDSSGD